MKSAGLSLAESPAYRVREVDGQDEEVADTLADLHRLTFFNGACLPDFDRGSGGSPVMKRDRLLLPASCHRRMPATQDTSAALGC